MTINDVGIFFAIDNVVANSLSQSFLEDTLMIS